MVRKSLRGRIAGTAVCALLLCQTAASASAGPQTVRWDAYLRAGPARTYTVVDELSPGTQVDVDSCADGWCKVTARDAVGYLEAKILSVPDIHAGPPSAPGGPTCFVAPVNGGGRGDQVRVCGP